MWILNMKIRRSFIVFLCLLGASSLVLFDSNAADVFLETKRSEFQKIPIWVMGFGDGKAGAQSEKPIGAHIGISQSPLPRGRIN
jgi:hypothetical protein